METDQGGAGATAFAQESQGWQPEGPRVCANLECGHRLSSSNREPICRACQSKEFNARVSNQAPWKRGQAPKGAGPLTLRSLRSEVQNPGVTRKRELPAPRLGPKHDVLVPALEDRRCICGELPHRGPCEEKESAEQAHESVAEAKAAGLLPHLDKVSHARARPGRRKRAADPAAIVEKVLDAPLKPTAFSEIAEKMVAAGFGEPAAGVTRVRAEDIPAVCQYRSPSGRIAQIWAELLACAPDERVRIDETSVVRAGSMASQLRGKAKRMGRAIDYRRDGKTLYAWFVAPDAKIGSAIMARIGAGLRSARTE